MLTTVSSLSGFYLAPTPALSTFPVTTTVIGTMSMIYPASWFMSLFGRQKGFIFKAVIGIFRELICCLGLLFKQFTLFTFGTFLLGIFSAFGQYYRFAAIDAAKTPSEHNTAIAIVVGAGVIGGFSGPFLSNHFSDLFFPVPYAGSFTVIIMICMLLTFSQLFLSSNLGLETAHLITNPHKKTKITIIYSIFHLYKQHLFAPSPLQQ